MVIFVDRIDNSTFKMFMEDKMFNEAINGMPGFILDYIIIPEQQLKTLRLIQLFFSTNFAVITFNILCFLKTLHVSILLL